MIINNFNDFYDALKYCGFSMGGANDEGIFSVSSMFSDRIQWHTGDFETDPWEFRMRVLDEVEDIAYSKVFFRKSGYISKEWYPYFYAIRRKNRTFEEDYSDGTISLFMKNIYDVIKKNDCIAFHAIKQDCGISKENSSKFEKVIIDLQMRMYITMCGRQQKISQKGDGFGWSSTVFCTVERFFGDDLLEKVVKISENEAIEKITEQIYRINPNADFKKIIKFI